MSAFTRLPGSVGWIAAPRAVYYINENPELPAQSVVAIAKTNLSERPEPHAFRKEKVDVQTDDGSAELFVTELEPYVGALSLDELFASGKGRQGGGASYWRMEMPNLPHAADARPDSPLFFK